MNNPSPASVIAEAIMNGKDKIDTYFGAKNVVGITSMLQQTVPLSLLERVEAFVSGFEGDPDQPGVAELLADLRSTISQHQH